MNYNKKALMRLDILSISAMVDQTSRLWNSLWPSLVKMSQRLEELGVEEGSAATMSPPSNQTWYHAVMQDNHDHEPTAGQQRQFEPAIDPRELITDPAQPSLDRYRVDWLPGQSTLVERIIQTQRLDPGKPKPETHSDALAEQRQAGIEFSGFEADPDFAGLEDKLEQVFGRELLDACLIDKMQYEPGTVAVDIEGSNYAIPAEEYSAAKQSLPEPEKKRFRAFSNFNTNNHPSIKQYLRLPIIVYSFEGEQLDSKPYLPSELDDTEKMGLYKIGTVVHEVGHALYENVLTEEERAAWESLVAESDALTKYSEGYKGKWQWPGEQFGELVRIMATNPDYLGDDAQELVQFMRTKFSAIHKIGQ
jgi:hypothetical protein